MLTVRREPQVAILAGDFLLARASVSLAALRDTEVIELLSQVIEHLVSGEILQARCRREVPAGVAAQRFGTDNHVSGEGGDTVTGATCLRASSHP